MDTWSSEESRRTVTMYGSNEVIKNSPSVYTTNLQGDQQLNGNFIAEDNQTTIRILFEADTGQDILVNVRNLIVRENYNWITNQEKWLNSDKNSIPSDNSFVLRKTSETEVIATDNLIPSTEEPDLYVFENYEPNVPGSITLSNVGYFNGENVTVKITMTSNSINSKHSINVGDGSKFLHMNVASQKAEDKLDTCIEFFDSKGQPLAVSGYWNFSNVNYLKSLTLKKDNIDNIYSIDREQEQPIALYFTENDQDIRVYGSSQLSSLTDVSLELPVTYSEQTSFNFSIIPTPDQGYTSVYITYKYNPYVKVDMPDPQGNHQKVTHITKNNESQLNYQFVQHIPYQSPSNMPNQLSWEITSFANTSALNQDEWTVADELGNDCLNQFRFSSNQSGNVIIEPKDVNSTNLYNHYYTFERKLVFSGETVDEDILIDKDQGKYLEYNGEIKFIVDDRYQATSSFSTNINFASTVDYHYLQTEPQVSVPGSENYPSQKIGLITHGYPIVTSPEIANYRKVSEVPENLKTAKLRYSQHQVTFNYENLGSIEIQVPESMPFKETELLSSQQTIVLREDPHWMIKMTDQRADGFREQWRLNARLTTPMTNSKGQILDSVVKFKLGENQPEYTLDTINSVPVYQSEVNPSKVTDLQLFWAENAGFYLDFNEFGFYPDGDYTSTIEFSLESGPI